MGEVDRITQERLHELLEYEAETGLFLWRQAHRGTAKGSVAGHVTPRGYRRIRLDGRAYPAGPLAWFYVHGEWPKETIDHINRVRHDDRISNLRPATLRQQRANTMPTPGRSLPRGVTIRRGVYIARIDTNGETRRLGRFATAEEAYAAYCAAAKEVFGEEFLNVGN